MEKNNFFITYSAKIKFVTNTQTKTNKAGEEYKIRSLAVELNDTNPKYPVVLVFDVLGRDVKMDKINMLDGLTANEDVVVTFTINSRPYTNGQGENKYFMSLNLIKVEKGAMNQDNSGITMGNPPEEDDLPF